jgi:hypothetical protein
MKNGDISNDIPKRLLINADIFVNVDVDITRKYVVLVKVKKHVTYDKFILSRLYRFAINTGITIELISYSLDQNEMDLLHAELDRLGTNPFRYATSIKSPYKLMEELPYRPEVIGVVDVTERKLIYGHWSYDLT